MSRRPKNWPWRWNGIAGQPQHVRVPDQRGVHNRLMPRYPRLGKQLRMPGMLVMTTPSATAWRRTVSAACARTFSSTRCISSSPTSCPPCFRGIVEAVQKGRRAGDRHHAERRGLLKSLTARTMLANSEYLVMLNQPRPTAWSWRSCCTSATTSFPTSPTWALARAFEVR
jgi:hypothetical protein